ncbi:MAG: hypothetical protein GXO65_05820 [Euryarchaeota archaeon]|nr:hypothetical protein [Euryarchaeota archaeon]
MGRRRSCIRCGEYIPGGGVELCDDCIAEIHKQGRIRRIFKTLLITALLVLGYYYVYYHRLT